MERARAEKLLGRLPSWRAFWFHDPEGHYTGRFATSLEEFAAHLREVELATLKAHASRGDFSRWVREAVGDLELAAQLGEAESLEGEALRAELLRLVEARVVQLRRLARHPIP